MKRNAILTSLLTVSCIGALCLNVGCQGLIGDASVASGPVPQSFKTGVNHIVFMLQENRSFDTYFGKLNQYRASQGLAQDVDGMPANASNPSVDGASQVAAYKLQ